MTVLMTLHPTEILLAQDETRRTKSEGDPDCSRCYGGGRHHHPIGSLEAMRDFDGGDYRPSNCGKCLSETCDDGQCLNTVGPVFTCPGCGWVFCAVCLVDGGNHPMKCEQQLPSVEWLARTLSEARGL